MDAVQVNQMTVLDHRVRIRDAELDVLGAEFYYQGYYVARGEPEIHRENTLRSRGLEVSFNGEWQLGDGAGDRLGTILQQWSGALVTSGINGGDDGRVYVALRVTGPSDGSTTTSTPSTTATRTAERGPSEPPCVR